MYKDTFKLDDARFSKLLEGGTIVNRDLQWPSAEHLVMDVSREGEIQLSCPAEMAATPEERRDINKVLVRVKRVNFVDKRHNGTRFAKAWVSKGVIGPRGPALDRHYVAGYFQARELGDGVAGIEFRPAPDPSAGSEKEVVGQFDSTGVLLVWIEWK